MTKLITLVRHGKVDGEPALYGHSDVALSTEGRIALERAIEYVNAQHVIDTITASPLIRCALVAQYFSTEYKIPLKMEPQLREMDFGIWDGVAFDEMSDRWAGLEAFWASPFSVHPPKGETLSDFAQRVMHAWEALTEYSAQQHHLVICHGGVIRIILAHILHLDWRNASLYQQLHIDYASTTRIEIGETEGSLPVVKWIGASVCQSKNPSV